jgi:hypothetical protein
VRAEGAVFPALMPTRWSLPRSAFPGTNPAEVYDKQTSRTCDFVPIHLEGGETVQDCVRDHAGA